MDRKRAALDLDQLGELEKRVERAIDTIATLRRERDEARAAQRAAGAAVERLEAERRDQDRDREGLQSLTDQVTLLQEERQQVRGRVTRMLEMMASLDEAALPARSEH
ncbi:MAG TPA: cell division protein ZapB [Dongiaceae bacterium]|nr:cell division protein ZapB [Dongiaceae bacterium]